jgi:hypothetical protein
MVMAACFTTPVTLFCDEFENGTIKRFTLDFASIVRTQLRGQLGEAFRAKTMTARIDHVRLALSVVVFIKAN